MTSATVRVFALADIAFSSFVTGAVTGKAASEDAVRVSEVPTPARRPPSGHFAA
jgi:hypothetical protein